MQNLSRISIHNKNKKVESRHTRKKFWFVRMIKVHALGIDEHHFYVICRNGPGIKTHHLHGVKRFENTHILTAQKRAILLLL